jgi:porin
MTTIPSLKIGAALGTLTFLLSPLAYAGSSESKEVVSTPDLTESLCGRRLLGDVGGLRRPEETGIDFRLEATNFYHGMLGGDPGLLSADDDDLTFAGKFDLFVNIDGQKAGLWPGLFINIHGEYRYGDNTNQGGVLSPVNTALLSPQTGGEAFALTNVTITQAFSESFLITLGKFNTIDLVDKLYYGGHGRSRFMNGSLTVMPIGGRTLPISSLGVVGTVLKDSRPFVNFGVMDSISPTSSPGWDGLRSDEMTFFGDITFHSDWDGRPGSHSFGASYSTIEVSSLDQSDIIRPPSLGGTTPNVANDSWQINYLWEQSLTRNPSAPGRGWGTFLFLALSDGDPNPFQYSAAAGLVANGVCSARPCDSLGLGLFYNGVGNELKDTLSLPSLSGRGIALGDEFGAEIYYDFAVTDWFRLTLDLQVIEAVLEDNDTAIFGGLRSRIIF